MVWEEEKEQAEQEEEKRRKESSNVGQSNEGQQHIAMVERHDAKDYRGDHGGEKYGNLSIQLT